MKIQFKTTTKVELVLTDSAIRTAASDHLANEKLSRQERATQEADLVSLCSKLLRTWIAIPPEALILELDVDTKTLTVIPRKAS